MQQLTLFFLVLCAAICPLLAQQSSLYPVDRVSKGKGWMYGGMVAVGLGNSSTADASTMTSITATANAVVRNSLYFTVHTCYMLTLQHATGTTGDVDFTAQTVRLQIGQIHELKLGRPVSLNFMWAFGFGIPLGGTISSGTVEKVDSEMGVALNLGVGMNVEISGVQVRPQLGVVLDLSTYSMSYTSNARSYSAKVVSAYPMFSCMVVL